MILSIIIPVYNQHSLAHDCIAAVRATTEDFELVVIDNGSEPEFIPEGPATVIRNIKNEGFPRAINQGLKAATGETVILLNDDCVCAQGWSERLLAHLDTYSIVGPCTNYCAGMQQVTIPVYQDEQEFNREAEKWAVAHAGESEEVNWIIGFCMAFKKSLWEEIGLFDESLWPCSGEEIDFCMRAKAKGYKTGIARDVYLHHEGSQTFRELEKNGLDYQEICSRNEKHLRNKWGSDVWLEQTLQNIVDLNAIQLNLGSGYAPQPGYINIDNRAEVNPDLVCDVLSGLPYGDSSVDKVRAHDFLEHIPIGKTIQVITEIWRVLKPGGIFESFTPSTDGRGAFQDPTHVSFWNKNSWLYYSESDYRNLYHTIPDFEIVKMEDTIPDPKWKIIHTLVIAKARKE